MFKKPPKLKASTPLRTSSRRSFLAHLQLLYPVLATASPELIQEVVPNGIKQCSAVTSADQKAVIYTDQRGVPLWFELGVNAGAALQQSSKKSDKAEHQHQSKAKLAEVFPTVYLLWIVPNLLPRLPTWPQIVDPTLLSGSALMIPGLIPPPNTFPEVQDNIGYPPCSSIISITAYPSSVPLVVARSEMDMEEICQKRGSGEKGKAATTIHAKGDYLWEMGGKKNPPSQEEVLRREEELVSAAASQQVQFLQEDLENVEIGSSGSDQMVSVESKERVCQESIVSDVATGPTFSVQEVDTIMYLALLQSLANISEQTDQLPLAVSSLYSSQVLPNRPAHWPPRDAKGRHSSRLSPSLVLVESNQEERLVNAETMDIRRTSSKKLLKWIKSAEKKDLLKCKEVKGKDTVIISINRSHADLQSLSPYYTLIQAQRDSTSTTAPQSDQSSAVEVALSKTVIVIEKFWKASASSVKLFQEMGASTSEPLSHPIIRAHLSNYITANSLVDVKNQAQIRLEDPILVHALYPKAQLGDIPASLNRQEILDRLLAISCVEYHRSSRLLPHRASQVQQANSKGKSVLIDGKDVLEPETDSEHVGVLSKGTAKPVIVEIKIRQGRKAVSLITGLETYGIDPHALAHELMKLGASASANALSTSTAKNPKHEVFVQGDQRKAIYNYIEAQGLHSRFIHLHDATKK